MVVQFLTISFVFFLALITPVFMLVCAFGECWRVCKQLVGCFLKCFDGSSSFWSLDGLAICFANFPWISCCFFTLFSVLHFTYYTFHLYNIITIAILCHLYQLLIGMTITYRNNFWLYIFVCLKINFALEIRRNNNFVIFQ